jgi:hypothetical protein
MPISETVDPRQQFVMLSVIDPCTIDEWCAAMLAALETPTFRQQHTLLIDRRHAEPIDVGFVDAKTRFFAAHQRELSGMRAAILVRDDAGFGMGRMTEFRVKVENPDVTIRTFRDYDRAVTWLTGR